MRHVFTAMCLVAAMGLTVFVAGCARDRGVYRTDALAYIDHMMLDDVAAEPVNQPVVDPLTRFPGRTHGMQNEERSPAFLAGAAAPARSPRVFIVESPPDRPGSADFRRRTASGSAAATYDRQVMRHVSAMEDEMHRITLRAEDKGVVAQSALEPDLREFRMIVQKIQERMEQIDASYDDPASPRRADLDALLFDAQQALQRADSQVTSAPYMRELGSDQ